MMKQGNQYKKGASAERKFVKMLLAGYNDWPPALWAARTPGSKSKFDVTAWWSDCVRGFQIKRGVGRVDDSEMVFLTGIARSTVGLAEVYTVSWPDYCPPTIARVR